MINEQRLAIENDIGKIEGTMRELTV